jgi:hypothetical protein
MMVDETWRLFYHSQTGGEQSVAGSVRRLELLRGI